MVRHKPWQVFICKFNTANKRHTVAVGAPDQGEVEASIMDLYGKVSELQIFKIENQE